MMGGVYLKIKLMTEFQTAMTAVTNQVCLIVFMACPSLDVMYLNAIYYHMVGTTF